ncbi:membrane-bound lytic murein transglycosylase F [Chromohalobacter marismortui]|uniref:Membrane-bound lytic murein transglycosylase F n=1 Tax=Chromohalobacter marismortui TaxID=42055 RepID=A0A4R7NTL6_9GAMM|nr:MULTISPECIES: membrane-bound lytic murein transglycosylase MltF [Chromohalobacter]MCI0509317.1 membrane-bound lytic murein transglycosylase MltF [Chromohalobacter sp.]MCI0593865.1 membrane-bound lytic murein transglycosylase MltF [Chromohalobacter sp.]TDU23790.1 membrane-bound lytic murein transglycosylase F [Chromohalobacter marismortui]
MLDALLRYMRPVAATFFALLALLTPDNRLFLERDAALSAISSRGFIEVATRNTPTTYYEGRHGPTGFEYELVQQFAAMLGVSLTVDSQGNIDDVLDAVRDGRADFGAANLALDPIEPGILYSRPIMAMQPLVIHGPDIATPETPQDLLGLKIAVIKNSGTSRALRALQEKFPKLSWQETDELEVTDLIEMVEKGELDAAVVYAHQFKINRLFFPDVERGFALGKPQSLVWAFPKSNGVALLQAANRLIARMQHNGKLRALIDQYFGHDNYLEYVGASIFIRHTQKRLPKYEDAFKKAARRTGFDWKLLAALGYQESHWKPRATSPTGVRGLMMLTNATAGEVGVSNRLDPEQSIRGGATYLKHVKGRLQEEITEPDRTWMALAAYNVGLGHLYDAQKIAEMRGGDPYSWADVRKALPLLQKRKWYSQVRHGYARGGEPVIYVRNIRRYYEILKYVDRSRRQFHQLGKSDDTFPQTPFNTVPPVL